MRRFIGITMMVLFISLTLVNTSPTQIPNTTEPPESLMTSAWQAFNAQEFLTSISHADAYINRYRKQATQLQKKLKDFPQGTHDDIHAFHTLNNMATALYIKGESLRHLNRLKEAQEIYQDLVSHFYFGQCWDPRGWFWKPAEVAEDKLLMLRSDNYYDFEDYSSNRLMTLAWKALDENDHKAVMAYTNKCIELYADNAKHTQAVLTDIPIGDPEDIHAYWDLNDVATAYFIQAESYFKNNDFPKARATYQIIIEHYPFAQCWDPRGWFWQVAAGAEEKIEMIDSQLFMNFWDYSSSALVNKAWQSLANKDFPRALGYAQKCIDLYEPQAQLMQRELLDYPAGDDDSINAYWALNDVATAYYIQGKVYAIQHQPYRARQSFHTVLSDYTYGQCWDPQGWWWKPATEAQNWIELME